MSGSDGADVQRYKQVVLALVAVLALTLAAVVWAVTGKNSAEDKAKEAEKEAAVYDAAADAESDARELLVDMTTYSVDDIDTTFDWLDRLASDDLRQKVLPNSKKFLKIIRVAKVQAVGEVRESAYRAVDANTAVVLAFVHQEIIDAQNRQPKVEEQWATLTLVRDGADAEWLVDDIELSTVAGPEPVR